MTDRSPATASLATPPSGTHAIIIGGGASGTLMAAHLLSQAEAGFTVTLLEGRYELGRGVAYSTNDPDHILNTRAHNMSAYPRDPDHFLRWLQQTPEGAEADGSVFVSRDTYGRYLSELLNPWLSGPDAGRLTYLQDSAVQLREDATGVTVTLASGQVIRADQALLATGHVQPEADTTGALSSSWDHASPIPKTAHVLIIGTGLSMVDQVLSLLNRGHEGPITSISRRGQLPRAHAPTNRLQIEWSDIPLNGSFTTLFAWARKLAAAADAQGGSWRDVVDALRPHVRAIWRNLPLSERARFLRHASAWWDVHRHRIPPASEARIQEAIASGQLRLERAGFVSAARTAEGRIEAQLLSMPAKTPKTLTVDHVIDCRGIRRDPVRNAQPVMADLFARGAARIDPLQIGLDVAEDCRILDRDGQPSARIRAIGPVSRSAFWEITAVPDIREQTADLAAELARQG